MWVIRKNDEKVGREVINTFMRIRKGSENGRIKRITEKRNGVNA